MRDPLAMAERAVEAGAAESLIPDDGGAVKSPIPPPPRGTRLQSLQRRYKLCSYNILSYGGRFVTELELIQ